MKANLKATQRDEAVSPVIGVILMVAITVVLAATVYVWVSGLANQSDAQENAAVRVTTADSDADGRDDYIKVLLIRGDNAPYTNDGVILDVLVSGNEPNGGSIAIGDGVVVGTVCTDIPAGGACTTEFGAGGTDTQWDVGQTLFAPCIGDGLGAVGTYDLTITVKGTVLFDGQAECQAEN